MFKNPYQQGWLAAEYLFKHIFRNQPTGDTTILGKARLFFRAPFRCTRNNFVVKGARPKERQSTDADTHRNMAAEGGLRVIKDKQKISDRCFWQVDRKVRSET